MRSLVCDATDSIDLYKTIFLMEAPAFSLLSADTDVPQLVVGTGTIYYSRVYARISHAFLMAFRNVTMFFPHHMKKTEAS